jgi:FkbM family methyltransferase
MKRSNKKLFGMQKFKTIWKILFEKYILLRVRLLKPLALKANCHGYDIKFSISSSKEFYYRYLSSYTAEPITVKWIHDSINKNEIAWDIGANVGAYSLLMGKKLQKLGCNDGAVIAFEPESSNYHSLNKNIILNELSRIIVAYPFAVGNKTRVTSLFLSSNEIGSATHAIEKPFSDGSEFLPTHIQGAIAISLDDLIFNYRLPFPNHLKIDVDGFEENVILGGAKILQDLRLKTILIEIGKGVSFNKINDVLKSSGFNLSNKEIASLDGLNCNYLYVRKND